jgi:hypothetical protein
MKKISSIFITALTICLLPYSIVSGQEKKNEQKIKIVIDDGSGKKVVIDTLIKDDLSNDSIVLKDGKVITIRDIDNDTKDNGQKDVIVTVTSDADGTNKITKEITVFSSDSLEKSDDGKHGKIYVYNNTKTEGGHYSVVTSTSGADVKKGERIVYINEVNDPDKESDKTFDVFVSTDDKNSEVEMTRYVIAKDGMVVTVEGNDEVKAKELIKEIENKMGVKNDGSEKKETVKAESKKPQKK